MAHDKVRIGEIKIIKGKLQSWRIKLAVFNQKQKLSAVTGNPHF